ncbi:MAG: ribosomal-processing cysteine protease Prp [Faecousia sp.]
MIEIMYHRGYHRITVKGHAGSAEEGKDLVCAAVSALVLTAVANVQRIEANGCSYSTAITADKGYAEIQVNPKSYFRLSVMQILDAICAGFEVLSQKYPEYVRYEVHQSSE